MLRSLAGMKGFKLAATDGELGDVRDFYFDDTSWTVRYLVADTSRWLAGRRVLIAPASLGQPSWENGTIPVALTKDQVKHAPDVDTDKPVSRQREIELARYYAWPEWWGVGGPVVPPAPAGVQSAKQRPTAVEDAAAWPADTHLRSLGEVVGYAVQARDERIGKVKDLITQTSSWIVRYLVVDVKTWRPGGEVLLAPAWVDRIDWADSCVVTEMSADDLRACPPYSPGEDLDREYEERLHDHLGQTKYWAS